MAVLSQHTEHNNQLIYPQYKHNLSSFNTSMAKHIYFYWGDSLVSINKHTHSGYTLFSDKQAH